MLLMADSDASTLADELERLLRAAGRPERAEKERAYLKSDLEFLGASVPQIRATTKHLIRDNPLSGHDELIDLVEALWQVPIHERRMAAVEVLESDSKLLTPGDLDMIERLLREARTWALVDGLAASVVGALFDTYPSETGTWLHRWSEDEDFWVRRASLLAYLGGLRRGEGDFEGFATKADRMLAEREFFIRKAIGWVLRETAKRRPQLIAEWLEPRAARASGLTVREAVKHLTPELRNRVLAARAGEGSSDSESGQG